MPLPPAGTNIKITGLGFYFVKRVPNVIGEYFGR